MINKEEFVAQLDRGAAMLGQLPVSSAVLKYLADDLRKGETTWWPKVAKAWEKREFGSWAGAWALLLACLHFEALDDAKSPLGRYFPSCGGTAEADPAPGLKAVLSNPRQTFFDNLKSSRVRAYYHYTASSWIVPAIYFFQERGLPYYLIEVGAGAGLNLIADWSNAIASFDHDLVAARIGLDAAPFLLGDIKQRRWMTAALYPDDARSIADFDRAAEIVLEGQRRDPTFIQLQKCATLQSPRFITKNVPSDDPDVGLLITNSMSTSGLGEEQYKAYAADMLAMMRPWGDRALWVECEFVPGEMYSMTLQVRVHRVAEGLLSSTSIGRFDFVANKHVLDTKLAQRTLNIADRKVRK